MMQFTSVDDLLDFAIREEEKASELYAKWAEKMEKAWMKKVFEDFSKEEIGHKNKLLMIQKGQRLLKSQEKVLDLKIAETVTPPKDEEEMDYQTALVFAMNKEKEAFKLYSDLAKATDDPELQETLLALAQEEAKHKLRFEVEYDDCVLQEN